MRISSSNQPLSIFKAVVVTICKERMRNQSCLDAIHELQIFKSAFQKHSSLFMILKKGRDNSFTRMSRSVVGPSINRLNTEIQRAIKELSNHAADMSKIDPRLAVTLLYLIQVQRNRAGKDLLGSVLKAYYKELESDVGTELFNKLKLPVIGNKYWERTVKDNLMSGLRSCPEWEHKLTEDLGEMSSNKFLNLLSRFSKPKIKRHKNKSKVGKFSKDEDTDSFFISKSRN